MTTQTYCVRADLADIIGEASILSAIDDNVSADEQAEETVFITNAINRAASEMNHALGNQYYPLSSLAGNEWCKWCNAYMACFYLQCRRGNAPPASVVENVQNYRQKLEEIRWGRDNVPEAIPTHSSQPAVSNFNVEPNSSDGPVVVDVNASTGGNPASGIRRNLGVSNFW